MVRGWMRVGKAALRATLRTPVGQIIPRHLKVLRSRFRKPYWGKL